MSLLDAEFEQPGVLGICCDDPFLCGRIVGQKGAVGEEGRDRASASASFHFSCIGNHLVVIRFNTTHVNLAQPQV